MRMLKHPVSNVSQTLPFLLIVFVLTLSVNAVQTEIGGPSGSGQVRVSETVLRKGNFIEIDTLFDWGSDDY